MVPKRAHAWQRTQHSELWFQQITCSILEELDPRVSRSVASALPYDESGVISHLKQLPPRPQCEAVTVSLASLLEFFWRLPLVAPVELLLVRNGFALTQKSPHIFKGSALHS